MRFSDLIFSLLILFVYGCSTSRQAAKNTSPTLSEPVDTVNFAELNKPPEDWYRLDENRTQFRGISAKLAYNTLLSDKEPKRKVIVAIIDSGIDIDHEDLKDNIWTNEGEIPGNGIDDDGNGYVDDVHGWNFAGGSDGKNVEHDTFELTRIYSKLIPEFQNADTTVFNEEKRKRYQ